jgi:N-acetylglutamate synthase-like GNAT family acetyltransferase
LTIQQKEFDIPIDLETQPDLKTISDFYQKNNGNFWVASIDQIVVGTIALLDIGNHYGALRKMFVKAEFRGSKFGVGQVLLNTLFKWTSEKGFEKILLGTTEKFLAAQRFYEKNGFVEIDKNLLPKEFPVMSVDVKFYKYTVHKS